MNRLPSPFQGDLPCVLNASTPSPTSSPGFLMMTRPPTAINTSSERGRYVPRGNHRSSPFNRTQTPYSSTSKNYNPSRIQNRQWHISNRGSRSFHNAQGSPFFGNKGNNNNQDGNSSPNRSNINKSFSFGGRYSQEINSPQNFQGNNAKDKNQNRSNFNHSSNRNHQTPLKDIPIDKFVSRNMINDPWVEFDSEIQNYKDVDILEGKEENVNDSDCIVSADEGISATDSPSTIESPSGSPSTPLVFSDKETESDESDNASDI